MKRLARILFAIARLGDALELRRLPLRARDAAIRCIHAGIVRRHVGFSP